MLNKINNGYYDKKSIVGYVNKPKLFQTHPTQEQVEKYSIKLKYYQDNINDFNERSAEIINYNIGIRNQFKIDAINYCGLGNHKNADKVFEYIWDENITYGYEAVINKLQEFSELML